ncbi:MAG: nucleoside deaminase [Odoribacteraceae bacterium]|jgi:tRNA(adenine34) deaminase|nr:nucleoside deaminase [Odoribacteraceae bacterium]
MDRHEFFMKKALEEARLAGDEGEIPVGAVVVCNDRVIARAHNQTERLNDVTAHAEMLAITAAETALGGKFLDDCTLYVTLEPCVMCGGALAWARVKELVYGATDPYRGYARVTPPVMHPRTRVIQGILASECVGLVERFFARKRKCPDDRRIPGEDK